MFLEQYLQSYGTNFKKRTKEEVSINCPFCNEAGSHFWFNLQKKKGQCFKCNRKINFKFLLSRKIFLSMFGTQVGVSDGLIEEVTPEQGETYKAVLPNSESALQHPIAMQYLRKRNFGEEDVRKYEIEYCLFGKFAKRLIFPIYNNQILMGFQGRDITGRSPAKYRSPHGFPAGEVLYGLDYCEPAGAVVLMEGILDVIRFGYGAVCSFGKKLSDFQLDILRNSFSRVVVVFDRDALQKAYETFKLISSYLHCSLVILPEGRDPADFPDSSELKSYISGNELQGSEAWKQFVLNMVQF
jgi:hypothetical protein